MQFSTSAETEYFHKGTRIIQAHFTSANLSHGNARCRNGIGDITICFSDVRNTCPKIKHSETQKTRVQCAFRDKHNVSPGGFGRDDRNDKNH